MADAGILSSLAPVVVGGLIGLAGGWLGPWLLEGRKQAAEKKKKRAEKFEELVAEAATGSHGERGGGSIKAFCIAHRPGEFERGGLSGRF
jgi:hypothetical protein